MTKRRLFSLLLILAFTLTALGATFSAGAAEEATVTVTVSIDGELAVTAQPVTVTELTLDAVVQAAHEQYYADGLNGYAGSVDAQYNMYLINTAWGIAGTPYLVLNGAPMGSGENSANITVDATPVKDRDNVIIMQDSAHTLPIVSMTYDGSTLSVLQWAFNFATFGYTESPYADIEILNGEGAVLGTTDADGKLTVPATGIAVVPGLAAISLTDAPDIAVSEPEVEIAYPDPEGIVKTAVKNEDGSITLAFTSDVHYNGGNNNLADWLDAAGIEYIDSFGFCGDMASAGAPTAADYWNWTEDVMTYMDSQITDGRIGTAVYTQGNHEWFPTSGGNYKTEYANYPAAGRLKQLGEAVRTDEYIIYCFGSGDIASTYACDFDPEDAAVMDEYLSTAPTDIPIFVLSHFPLHTWTGPSSQRVMDHAGDVIDVLNKYPNVILLWGHNHTEYDDNYFAPKFPGDEIVIDGEGTARTLNFTTMAAGCTSDSEYSGADGGSASTLNKGLVVTIAPDGTLKYDYITLDGQVMHIDSPWLVRFRSGTDQYADMESQYVEDGQIAAAVTAPEVEGYSFKGWYTWQGGTEVAFDFTAPISRNTLVTAKYAKVISPVAAPDAASCVIVTPDATFNGESLTMTATGVGDLITVFDLASIGYGTGIEYGFWFDPDAVISFDRDVDLFYQGSATDFTLKAGEFYKVAGFGEHYLQLDDGSMFLLLEQDAPGNFASLPGDQPFSAFPGTIVTAGAVESEPEPAPVEPESEPEPAPVEPEAVPESATTYTVKAGDTLWRIAKVYYGSGFDWDVIYAANADIIKNPRLIYVGQVLQIP